MRRKNRSHTYAKDERKYVSRTWRGDKYTSVLSTRHFNLHYMRVKADNDLFDRALDGSENENIQRTVYRKCLAIR